MTDYGQELRFGSFLTPSAADPAGVVDLATVSERAGLDLVTIQDHPYQPRFLDTWTLLGWIAARTTTVTVAPDVANLPLRGPVILARSAASLDRLSGGRVELGLGSGAFWDAVAANGGPHRSPGEAVDALIEAIEVIRALWSDEKGAARVDGTYYRLTGAKRGPFPAHDLGIWLGAYGKRMLDVTGRFADGWLPSSFAAGPEKLGEMSARVDEGAHRAGRDPAAIRRLYNISGTFAGTADGSFLHGPPEVWAEQLAELTLRHGTSTFVLGSDERSDLERFAGEVAPRVRELVAAERR
ncbi:Coenzyme F420-dependent N5,N10-methylene tetrahydromethanopterin reductase and related flavin-dependent oxidoreductases [Rhodococcus rhodochrous J45]|uniref:Coenzyme F420-dependent N5,N10-methylene tetrahydromethanopterin reductase and related flavin-dependent oxidoreductases n=1 Tax=Rhodococcus rhodochrous J45 TaxID=935266 RepID=A0A562E7U7_RHORH|nr:LLM class flavin-dependent oxidoreductase [Rhodococcus rhodochrous]TWH18182.1 Coenzyme F420-dependent N5,N10-methylene tetrahydromethanopterin reductase and related flavin-dependent oxidoreductases [Rhodococcus rhodochrous J45]